MFDLYITKVKYPKNETLIFEFSKLENLLKDLQRMIENKSINKNDIIRIEVDKND